MSSRRTTYAWLKNHIATLPRNEGVFLTEIDIAREAGTSRTPVREAFMRLESEGLLELIPRRGAWVPPVPDSEITTVMRARVMVEEWSVRSLAGHAPQRLIADLDRYVDEQSAATADPVAFIEVDRTFHTALVGATNNDVVARFYGGLLDRQQRMRVYAESSEAERSYRVVDEHREIVRRIETGDADAAVDGMIAHLEKTLAAMLGVPAHQSGHSAATSVRGGNA